MTITTITAGDASVGPVITPGNDGTIVLQSGLAGSKVNAVTVAADGTQTFLKLPINPATPSIIRLNTTNGVGSTNTAIRRWLNVVQNQGTDITYADSATLGASFTINTTGIYSISHTDVFNGGVAFGPSLNATGAELTTSFVSLTLSKRLAYGYTSGADFAMCVAVTMSLTAGDIVRCHGNGTSSVAPDRSQFTIARVT